MDFSEIIYEKSDRIATVTMNRPERMNAWTLRMGGEIRAAMRDADRDDNIRAVIVTGAGRAYCAGADMNNLSDIAEGRASMGARLDDDGDWLAGARPDFRGSFSWVLALRKPVIAAINGACVGLGLTSALYYDIRIASDRARLGLIFPQRGLAIEHGSSWMLPRIIGLARAIELAVTGRLVDAQEALSLGLVTRVVNAEDLIPTARQIAGEIASKCSPLGVAQARRLVYEHLFTDLATAIREDDEAMGRMALSEDFKEGVKAFIEKRPPRFVGR
ncbi:MAG: enoyl-CoA hydratase-related protein [Candidatus Binataceae bacterium]